MSDVSKSLAEKLGLQYIESLGDVSPPQNLEIGEFNKIIGTWAKQNKVIPLKVEDGNIIIAVSDPLNTEISDVLSLVYGMPTLKVVAPEDEILKAINNIRTKLMTDRESSLESEEKGEITDTLKIDVTDAEDDEAPIIRYVNTLIFRAASMGASDIHIEPFEQNLKVRFRVDGCLLYTSPSPRDATLSRMPSSA